MVRSIKEKVRLSLLRTIPRFWRRRPENVGPRAPGPERILLIRPDHLGDVLFTTPALRMLRQGLPQAEITYLVGPWSQEVIQHNQNLDSVLTCPFPGFSRRSKGSPWEPYIALLREAGRLRGYRFHRAINLRFDFWWGAMLAYFAGIPQRLGYGVAECRPFLTHPIPYQTGRHEVEQDLTLVAACLEGEMEPDPGPLELSLSGEDEAFVEGWLARAGLVPPIIAILPGTGWPVKLWRSEAFAQLADALIQHHGVRIIIAGSESERMLVGEVLAAMHNQATPLIGASLGQLAALLRRCSLALGLDSGAMHLAVAMGAPSVHLYGPVDAHAFGPWGDPQRHVVVRSEMACIPCNRLDYAVRELEAHPCVRSIPVERVLAAAEALLLEVGLCT